MVASGEISPEFLDVQPFACGSWMNAVAHASGWMQSTDFSCAIAGDATSKVSYWWERDVNAIGGTICLEGRGARIPLGSPAGTGGVLYWHSGGCSSNHVITVDWQSSLHNKTVRFTTGTSPAGGVGFKWK